MHVTWWMPSSFTSGAYFTRSREGAAGCSRRWRRHAEARALHRRRGHRRRLRARVYRLADLPERAWAALTAKNIAEGRNTPAPHSGKHALKILRADVMRIAHAYKHKRYRAVCADLTKKDRAHLGGTKECILKIAVINAFVPIKKFTITAAKFRKGDKQAAVSLYVNGKKKHLIHAVVKWEGGAYRLDSQSGWHPKV